MKRIPSKWTKKMFLSASWYALIEADDKVRRHVAFDLHNILLFGFSNWRERDIHEYDVDYTKYNTELFE